MSRELKFRMWHKKSKKMYDVEKINIKDKLLNMWNSKFYSSSLFSFDEVELMQYTGLKDKNGVEIYEGDIVKYKDSTGLKIEEVIFDKGCFYAGEHGGSSTRVSPKLINTRITEVIGNIYENPELIGGYK